MVDPPDEPGPSKSASHTRGVVVLKDAVPAGEKQAEWGLLCRGSPIKQDTRRDLGAFCVEHVSSGIDD